MIAALASKYTMAYQRMIEATHTLAIPSFFEIKESDGGRKLSKKTQILFFRSPR
jgi:hypothetical protein